MGRLFLTNAFSLNMLGQLPQQGLTVKVRPISLEEAKTILQAGYQSAVGHPSTAQVIEALVGLPVEANRVAITLQKGDKAVVFQLTIRLAEGQVLSREEVLALYQEGKASFMEVEVLG
jgi:hypothetical protein